VNPLARIGLIVAYAVLALAALGRSSYQVSTKFADAPLAYSASALAALLYAVIAVALLKGLSQVALVGTSVELAGVVIVGTLGYIESSWWPDETVWTGYGSAYGWVPLMLPMLALWALIHTRRRARAGSSGS
jgi:hypothetical protein